MTKLHSNHLVICVFERDEIEWDQGQLIQIFQDPKDALEYIEKAKNDDLFYEQWHVTERRNGKQ